MEEKKNIKHEYTIISTEDETVVKSHNGYIEFCDEYLKQVLDYVGYDTEDEDKVQNHVYNKNIVDKYAISGICLYRVVSTGNWCIDCHYGRSSSIIIQFKEFPDAKKLHNDLIAWRYDEKWARLLPYLFKNVKARTEEVFAISNESLACAGAGKKRNEPKVPYGEKYGGCIGGIGLLGGVAGEAAGRLEGTTGVELPDT